MDSELARCSLSRPSELGVLVAESALMLMLAVGCVAKLTDRGWWTDVVGLGAVFAQGLALALLLARRRVVGGRIALGFYAIAATIHLALPMRGCSCLGAFAHDAIRLELLVAAIGGLCATVVLWVGNCCRVPANHTAGFRPRRRLP